MTIKRFFPWLPGISLLATLVWSTNIDKPQALADMPSPLPTQLRVLSYNIHHCNPPAKPDVIDVDAIAQVIKAQQPDLVALQEVDVNTQRAGKLDQAQLLAQKTGMQVFFAKAIDFSGGEYGIAILSRFPILEGQKYPLPSLPSTKAEARVMATIRLKTPSGIELIMANTHLDSQREETNRLLQIEEIGKISSRFVVPTIIAGDFNATPGSRPILALDESFKRTCDDCAATIPADKPRNAIDFIAYKPTPRIRVVSQEVVDEPHASDHRPTFSVLQIDGK